MSKSEVPVEGLVLPLEYIQRAERLCHSGQRTILAIAGAPGSGKSTIARLLHEALVEYSVLVPMDGFHLSNKELERLKRQDRKGAFDTFDVCGYQNLMKRLKNQHHDEIIYVPEFYRTIEDPISASIPVDVNVPLVITEGNYLAFSEGKWGNTHLLFDEVWFITAPKQERKQRLIDRHRYFGRSLEDATIWVEQIDEPNAYLIEQYKSKIDVFIDWKNGV